MAVPINELLHHEQLMYDLTGKTREEFEELLPLFEQAWEEEKLKEFKDDPQRKRKPGAGRKGYLRTMPERLLFILLYYHVHPTYDVLRQLFGYSKGSARRRVRSLRPVLENTVGEKLKIPHTRVSKLKTFYEKFPEAKEVFDAEVVKKKKAEKSGERPEPKHVIFSDNVVVESNNPAVVNSPQPVSSPQRPPSPNTNARWTHPEEPQTKEDDLYTKPLDQLQAEERNVEEQMRDSLSGTKTNEEIIAEVKSDAKEIEQGSDSQEHAEQDDQKKEGDEQSKGEEQPQEEHLEYRRDDSKKKEEVINPQSLTDGNEQPKPKIEDLTQGIVDEQEKEPSEQDKILQRVSKQIAKKPKEEEESTDAVEDLGENTTAELERIKKKINEQLKQPSEELSIIDFVDSIIKEGYYSRASDIHVEPQDKDVVVRLRIDGVLHDVISYPKVLHSAVITRIKVIAGLRTDEHQAAQDGRFKTRIPDEGYIDIRVSIAPTYYGENSVMRVLTQKEELGLSEIGLHPEELEKVRQAAKRPYGMILSSGPTGSGKTTSLYAVIKLLNTRDVSIITIEDPIEYSIKGIDQIQVNPKTGLTFASGLRSLLRQDPDIIMVGEIRDEETAGIATNAALTGHLLLSTLHTNDAATALPRLVDMGIEPFLVASTVNVIIGQRLVRKICKQCKVEYELSDDQRQEFIKLADVKLLEGQTKFHRGEGCEECGESGYMGRIGIFEVLEMAENIKTLVMSRASSDDIKYVAIKNGMRTMLEDGIRKAIQGITTLEEVLRVARE